MDSAASLALYLLVFALAVFFVFLGQQRQRKWLIGLGLALPVLLAALRYEVGVDYVSYAGIYDRLAGMSPATYLTGHLSGMEPLTYLFAQIAHWLSLGTPLFFGLFSLVTVTSAYAGIAKLNRKWAWLGLLLYLCFFFSMSLNTVRQSAGVAVAFYAIADYITSERQPRAKLKLVVLLLAAVLLHYATILAFGVLIIYWIAQKLRQQSVLTNCLVWCGLAAALFGLVVAVARNAYNIPLLEKYAYLVDWMRSGVDAPVPNLLPRLLPLVAVLPFIRRFFLLSPHNSFYFGMAMVAVAVTLTGYFIPYGYRVAEIFMIFQIPLFLNAVEIFRAQRQQLAIVFCLALYGLAYFAYSSYWRNSYATFPYRWYLLEERAA